MKSVLLCASALAVLLAADIAAQPPASHANDPRVGLKAGLRNAGVAARNLELVASLPKPAGFFDPAAPAGSAISRSTASSLCSAAFTGSTPTTSRVPASRGW
jgi:hypothetical protein